MTTSKEVARIDRFLEQTTFVDHALVFQEGFTLNGPRTYSVLDGSPPSESEHWTEDWPVGTMDRKFGDHQLAYMLCRQELRPNVYTSTNVIYAGAKRRCSMTVEGSDHTGWSVPLKDEGTRRTSRSSGRRKCRRSNQRERKSRWSASRLEERSIGGLSALDSGRLQRFS